MAESAYGDSPSGVIPIGIIWITVCVRRRPSCRCEHLALSFSVSQELKVSKVVRFHHMGGPEPLQIDDVNVRPPAAGEVRIKVKALGLS